jgi:hypothetical protein
MKTLIKRLSNFFSYGALSPLRGEHFTASDDAATLRAEGRWEDALMACMYDENARTYLDYIGRRGR